MGYPIDHDGDGNIAVMQLAGASISGNILPIRWLTWLKTPSGKPDVIACVLLADIVYWYRPREIRDEQTGQIEYYEKKFAADKLQRGYGYYRDLFGLSKNQVRFAVDRV